MVKMVYPLVIACGTQTSLDFTILGSMGQTSSCIHRIGYIVPLGRSDDIHVINLTNIMTLWPCGLELWFWHRAVRTIKDMENIIRLSPSARFATYMYMYQIMKF